MRRFQLIFAVLLLGYALPLSAQQSSAVTVTQSVEQDVPLAPQLEATTDAARDSIAAMFLVPRRELRSGSADSLGAPQEDQQERSASTKTRIALILVIVLVAVIAVRATALEPA